MPPDQVGAKMLSGIDWGSWQLTKNIKQCACYNLINMICRVSGMSHPWDVSRLGVLAVAFLAALPGALAAAEIPVARDYGPDFRVIVESPRPLASSDSWKPNVAVRPPLSASPPARSVSPPASESNAMGRICGSHTIGSGWRDRQMRLYLGEGAREHLDTIREAAKAWNSVLHINPIVLQEDQEDAVSYPLSPLAPDQEGASDFYGDGVSVLYFSAQRTPSKFGYVLARQETESDGKTRLTEADVFIWSQSGTASDLDLLIALQHELGHALGLTDTAISGNVMSNDYRRAIEDSVDPLIVLGILPDYDDRNLSPGELNLFDDPRYSVLLRSLVRPQMQDKVGILCMYPFEVWGQGSWGQ